MKSASLAGRGADLLHDKWFGIAMPFDLGYS